MEPMHNPMCDSLTLNRKCDCGLDVMKARIAELEAALEHSEAALLRVSLGAIPSGQIASYTSASADLIHNVLHPQG